MFYYLDTSIWLDYYEKRGTRGSIALNMIKQLIDKNSIIIYSDLHIKEMKGLGYNLEEINNIFKIAKPDNMRVVHINKEQLIEANKIAYNYKIPKRDALHAILARDNESIMIATDKHFDKIKHIVEVFRPEEIY